MTDLSYPALHTALARVMDAHPLSDAEYALHPDANALAGLCVGFHVNLTPLS